MVKKMANTITYQPVDDAYQPVYPIVNTNTGSADNTGFTDERVKRAIAAWKKRVSHDLSTRYSYLKPEYRSIEFPNNTPTIPIESTTIQKSITLNKHIIDSCIAALIIGTELSTGLCIASAVLPLSMAAEAET